MAYGSRATQFDHLTEEDFVNALEHNPADQHAYAALFGVSRSTLYSHMQKNYPDLWARIRGEIGKRRTEIRAGADNYTQALNLRAHHAEARKRALDIQEDVRSEVGRTVANLKTQVAELRDRNKELSADLLDQENLVARVAAASTEPLPKPKFQTGLRKNGKKPERAILLPIFDMQFGAKVEPDDTVGRLGHFNSNVFAERAMRYVQIVASKIRAEAAISRIGPVVFAIGGDTVEGDEIFRDMAWSLEMPPTDAVILVRDWLAYIVEAIMEVGHEVGATHYSVVTTPGNHGKVGGRKRAGTPKRYNWDVMVYTLLEERLANFPIHNFVIEPGGNCAFEVLGNPFAMIHGDEVRAWGSIPFYGMTRMDAKMIRTLNFIPDYVLLGHHHQQANIPIGYGEWLMSGNWVGASGLSREVGSNQPKQSMFMVDEKNGVLDRIPILLDDRRKPQPTIHKTS